MWKQERLQRNIENSRSTRHHIIAKCRKDMFDVFNPINITKIRRDTHKSLHTLFTDENWPILEPKLQLKKLFDIVSPVLSQEIKNSLIRILNTPDERFYTREVLY
jgi:hypothetical protein